MSNLIRILVVDNHQIVRRGLATLLIAKNGMQVVGEAADGEEAVLKAQYLRPDVIVMELIMPKLGGLDIIRVLRDKDPNTRILVLTSYSEKNYVLAAIKAGALGYLRKDSSSDELFCAIRSIAEGNSYLPQEIVQELISDLQQVDSATPATIDLTEREIDVLGSLAKGMTNQEIADTLVISPTTVRTHVRNVLGKLGLNNRTQAALYALECGIV